MELEIGNKLTVVLLHCNPLHIITVLSRYTVSFLDAARQRYFPVYSCDPTHI